VDGLEKKQPTNIHSNHNMSKLVTRIARSSGHRLLRSSSAATASGQPQRKPFHTGTARLIFEPTYLDKEGLKPPKYEALNIQLKGYDFEVLENHQSYIHNLAENIGINVGVAWATACDSSNASIYAPQSTKISSTFALNTYERNIQVVDVLSTELPVLLDVLRKTLPEGVSLSVHKHEREHYEAKFIPDPLISSCEEELNEIEEARAEAIAIKRAEREAKQKAKGLL